MGANLQSIEFFSLFREGKNELFSARRFLIHAKRNHGLVVLAVGVF